MGQKIERGMYRGKTEAGKWVYGWLIKARGKVNAGSVYIIPEVNDACITGEREFRLGTCYAVDPKTVGAFTGVYDMNGKEVFEGDVIAIHERGGYRFRVCRWNEEKTNLGFCLVNEGKNREMIPEPISCFSPRYISVFDCEHEENICLSIFRKMNESESERKEEVIRCKDCQFFDEPLCRNSLFIREPDDFCSNAKRKENT